MKGGESGPALVPGEPERSLLIKAVRYSDENLQMPPKDKKLSADQIAALEQWVRLGAPDPRHSGADKGSISAKAANHWAFRALKQPALPAVKDSAWVRQPLDAFVLAKLEANGLRPSPATDRRTLIRRATFDLIGLPPTTEEVHAFEVEVDLVVPGRLGHRGRVPG